MVNTFSLQIGLLLTILCYGVNTVVGQNKVDTTLSISAIEVRAVRELPTGNQTQQWNAKALQQLPVNNLGELLALETRTFVKSYGLGSLATTSVRGGNAGHTLVLWNGLPIQSPMLGLLDLSLLPTNSVEQVRFTKGGNSTLWGSGAVGGIVAMENRPRFGESLHLFSESQMGSFGQRQQQLQIRGGNEHWHSNSRFSHQQANNDFFYTVSDNLPQRQQTHARMQQQLWQQDVYWKKSDRQQLALHFWQQQTERELPPTSVQTRSEAEQSDRITRLSLAYQRNATRGVLQAKLGLFDENQHFTDPLAGVDANNRFRTHILDLSQTWSTNERHRWVVGNTHTFTRAWSDGYRDQIPDEYRLALFGAWHFQHRQWRAKTSLRQTVVDGRAVPFLPALEVAYQLSDKNTFKAKVSRNYRLPTFNERFWQPGGNPDLLPESGWSQELGVERKVQSNRWQYTLGITAFSRKMNNWILWSLQPEQPFWAAYNVTQVWSRGIEPIFLFKRNWHNGYAQLKLSYDYIRSTATIGVERPNIPAGEQLRYTPVHRAFSSLTLQSKSWQFGYWHSFTGPVRAVTTDLAGYDIGSLKLQYSNTLNNCNIDTYIQINNILNRDYRVLERRPMPGIHGQVGLRIGFQRPKSVTTQK